MQNNDTVRAYLEPNEPLRVAGNSGDQPRWKTNWVSAATRMITIRIALKPLEIGEQRGPPRRAEVAKGAARSSSPAAMRRDRLLDRQCPPIM